MNQQGLGVIIGVLAGNKETVDAFRGAIGKTISSIKLSDDRLCLEFTDGTGIVLYDDGQSCCESRYMRTDDKLEDFIGGTFDNVILKEAPPIPGGEEHEVQFLEVQTSKGPLTMSSHNEHNGYYGGFHIIARTR